MASKKNKKAGRAKAAAAKPTPRRKIKPLPPPPTHRPTPRPKKTPRDKQGLWAMKPRPSPLNPPPPVPVGRSVPQSLPPVTMVPVTITPEVDEDGLDNDGLTPKQRKFVLALIGPAGGNATRAAQLAGYRDDNANALRAMACRTKALPRVQAAIAREVARLRLDSEWAKLSLVEVAGGSMANFLRRREDGNYLLDLDQAAELGALGQIRELKQETLEVPEDEGGGTIIKQSIKLHDRGAALALLLKMHGLLTDKVDLTSGGLPVKGYADVDDGEAPEVRGQRSEVSQSPETPDGSDDFDSSGSD